MSPHPHLFNVYLPSESNIKHTLATIASPAKAGATLTTEESGTPSDANFFNLFLPVNPGRVNSITADTHPRVIPNTHPRVLPVHPTVDFTVPEMNAGEYPTPDPTPTESHPRREQSKRNAAATNGHETSAGGHSKRFKKSRTTAAPSNNHNSSTTATSTKDKGRAVTFGEWTPEKRRIVIEHVLAHGIMGLNYEAVAAEVSRDAAAADPRQTSRSTSSGTRCSAEGRVICVIRLSSLWWTVEWRRRVRTVSSPVRGELCGNGVRPRARDHECSRRQAELFESIATAGDHG